MPTDKAYGTQNIHLSNGFIDIESKFMFGGDWSYEGKRKLAITKLEMCPELEIIIIQDYNY